MATGIVSTDISKEEISKWDGLGGFVIEYQYLDTTELCRTKSRNLSYKNVCKDVRCKNLFDLAEAKEFIIRLRKKAAANPTIALVRIYMREAMEGTEPEGYDPHYWLWTSSENI